LKRPVAALLLVTSFTWSVPAAAFSFCFSMGGGSRINNHAGYYAPPLAPGVGTGWYPASPYMAPAPRPVILPVVIQEERVPAGRDSYPEQHIFR
jgi:hypothetical protein